MMLRKLKITALALAVSGLFGFANTVCLSRAEAPTLLGMAWTIEFHSLEQTREAETWTPLFEGVEFMRGKKDAPLQKVCVLRVDTRAEGVSFFTTGPHKNYQDTVSETERTTAADFLEENQLAAAVNANFYSPFNASTRTSRGPSNVIGLAVSEGIVVSKSESSYPVFCVSSNGVSQIKVMTPEDSLEGIRTAVAGNMIVLKEGKVVEQSNQDIHPRTAVGISKDHRYIYLMTIDGRQPLYSIGATYQQVGEWLLEFGAWDGLNLDGGGSTTMVVRDTQGKAQVLNMPIGNANIPGYLRHNANHLGVRAKELKD